MKRLFLVLSTAIVVLPWLTPAKVQAEMIQWTATGSLNGPDLYTNGTAQIASLNYGGADAHILLYPGLPTTGTNSGTVVLSTVLPVVLLPAQDVAFFGGANGNYSLNLALRDLASGDSGSLNFRGNLSGIASTGADAPSITNSFIGPTSQTLTLGRDLYTVTIGPYAPSPTFGTPGSISASISVQPLTSSTPEPSSLLLACLALPPLGLARWLRRRREVWTSAHRPTPRACFIRSQAELDELT